LDYLYWLFSVYIDYGQINVFLEKTRFRDLSKIIRIKFKTKRKKSILSLILLLSFKILEIQHKKTQALMNGHHHVEKTTEVHSEE